MKSFILQGFLACYFFTFSPHLGCLANYNLMDSHLLRGNERETGVGCYIVIVLTCC